MLNAAVRRAAIAACGDAVVLAIQSAVAALFV
ncbi:MAG: hypothetical protein ACJASD_002606 [Sphingomonas echinoides]|jgi:hypothetical protein